MLPPHLSRAQAWPASVRGAGTSAIFSIYVNRASICTRNTRDLNFILKSGWRAGLLSLIITQRELRVFSPQLSASSRPWGARPPPRPPAGGQHGRRASPAQHGTARRGSRASPRAGGRPPGGNTFPGGGLPGAASRRGLPEDDGGAACRLQLASRLPPPPRQRRRNGGAAAPPAAAPRRRRPPRPGAPRPAEESPGVAV